MCLPCKYPGSVAGLRVSARSPSPFTPPTLGPPVPRGNVAQGGWWVQEPPSCCIAATSQRDAGPALEKWSTRVQPHLFPPRGRQKGAGKRRKEAEGASSSAAHASRASLGCISLPGMMLYPAGVLHAKGVRADSLQSPVRLGVLQGSQGLAARVQQRSLISPYQDFPNSTDRGQRHRQCRVHSAAVIWLLCATRSIA